MTMIQKLKKSKKGFTLVELLVVLVILAILAAAIIPSMMGFIDKAKEESVAAECRSVLLASQVIINEEYGLKSSFDGTVSDTMLTSINTLADLPGTVSDVTVKADGTHFFINAAKYTTADGDIYEYSATTVSDGKWTKGVAGTP